MFDAEAYYALTNHISQSLEGGGGKKKSTNTRARVKTLKIRDMKIFSVKIGLCLFKLGP